MYGTLISSVTVGAGGSSSISFSAIPGTFTDLVLVLSGRSTVNGDVLSVVFNSDTSTTYTTRILYGNGSSAASRTDSTTHIRGGIVGANAYTIWDSQQIYIPNYAGSTNKSVSIDAVEEKNQTTAEQRLCAGIWPQTAAITSITLGLVVGGNFQQYSTAYLYGLLKGSGGATAS